MPRRLIDVALPLPLFQTFTYAVDGETPNPVVPGSRVLVPVRNQRAIGFCLGEADGDGVANPRAVLDVPDAEPALTPSMLALCRWLSDYYVVPIGLVLRCVLPAVMSGADAPR